MPDAYEIDDELDHVTAWFRSRGDLGAAFGTAVRQALDEVIDTARTGRWDLEDCGNQEKAFVGVRIEHVIRGVFDLSFGVRGMDYDVDGVDVDCKWSKSFGRWQIPIEAAGHICLLIWADDDTCELAVGLIRIRPEDLVGGNRDGKKTISAVALRNHTVWLVPRQPILPENFLLHLDPVDREAILRHKGGDARARELFIRCEGRIIHRHMIESIGQQIDESRRFRGETKAAMRLEGFEVLNGHWRDQKQRAAELGGPVPRTSAEWVCLRSDGSTARRIRDRETAVADEIASRTLF